MDKNDKVVINITKKDKVYLSVILALTILCLCLAIILPRPYKTVEVNTPVYEKIYQKVYETKNIYIMNPSNILFDQENNSYEDINHNVYGSVIVNNYIDTGAVKEIKVSVMVGNGTSSQKKVFKLGAEMVNFIVSNNIYNEFGVDVRISATLMENIKNGMAENSIETGVLDNYLFEIEFERAVVNYIVAYWSV